MTIANFHPAGGHAKTLPSMPTLKCKVASPLTILMLASLSLNAAHAALTATTAQTIQGTAPYFTLGGVSLTNTAELLGFTYTDASGTTGTKATADAAVDGTSIIVDPNMKMSDIKALVPITNSSTPISTILGSDLNVADVDGDASAGNTGAIGTLKAYWTKDGTVGYTPSSTEKFDACSTYQLTIAIMDPGTNNVANTAGNIEAQTTYGDPNNQQYAYPATAGSTPTTIYSATYTIQPKVVTPYACWAQPNLTNGTSQYAGSPTQWNPTKGFLPQTSPNKNFPTTGFYGAWFNLTVAGTTAASIINKMDSTAGGSPLTGYVTSGDVKLKLVESSPNVVNITLYGPRDDNVTTQTEAGPPTSQFSAPTFTLKDAAGTAVYTFKIDKWFITKNVNIAYSTGGTNVWSASNPYGFNGNLETPNYCANLGGTGKNWYRVPSRAALTNSAVAGLTAWDGTPGTGGYEASPNNYRRAIGGGLFTEWGNTSYDYGKYSESEFIYARYYTNEPVTALRPYVVTPDTGLIAETLPTITIGNRVVCISD